MILDLLREAKASGDYRPLMDAVPYTRWLGISFVHLAGEHLGKLTYREDLVGNPALPALHGGTLGALLESTAIALIFRTLDTVALPKTITLTIDYLRSAKPVDTYAQATITRQGRRVVTVSVRAWQEDRDKPVAMANVHFLITPPDEVSQDAAVRG